MATYGDFLSPIRAHFQNVPDTLKTQATHHLHITKHFFQFLFYPTLFLSIILGNKDLK